MVELLGDFLELVNETLTAAIVIIAASLLLYNLTRNLGNRVARASAIVLACVTVTYIGDVFISLGPNVGTFEATLRLQWIGIAFIPAATFHLSDALLSTTGLPSRWKRRHVVRLLYIISGVFLIGAAFTNELIEPLPQLRLVSLQAGVIFPIYSAYFILAAAIALYNVQRARLRCLTRDTRRRMAYLQATLLTPALGIFPYSVLLGPGEERQLAALLLLNIANFVIILMLLFLAYPLSFFGSLIPDRVVKTELLSFVLRGPATGLIVLVVLTFTAPATRILGLPTQNFQLFGAVAVVLLWQWAVALSLPWLEHRLIYYDETHDELGKLQSLGRHLLTPSDLLQLLEAILAATCDYLRVNTAFVIASVENQPEIIASIGPSLPTDTWVAGEAHTLAALDFPHKPGPHPVLRKWHSYWVAALLSPGAKAGEPDQPPLGYISIQARSPEFDLSPEELHTLSRFLHRASQALNDVALQSEIMAALEGLLPQIALTRTRATEIEYRPGREQQLVTANGDWDKEKFVEQVRAALRHYWGGPGLTESLLLELGIVHSQLTDSENSPITALRAILQNALETLRPEGDRNWASPEWTLYNILELRFLKRHKVRAVAGRLALSEADLYRKQRVAIEALADVLIDMERSQIKAENRPNTHLFPV